MGCLAGGATPPHFPLIWSRFRDSIINWLQVISNLSLFKFDLAVLPTSACAFYLVTLPICDKVIRFCFLGLVIHFANLLCMFEITALARWISLTAYIASKQLPCLCSVIGVTVECFATNWDLINFALLAIWLPAGAQHEYQVKYIEHREHVMCGTPNFCKIWNKELYLFIRNVDCHCTTGVTMFR